MIFRPPGLTQEAAQTSLTALVSFGTKGNPVRGLLLQVRNCPRNCNRLDPTGMPLALMGWEGGTDRRAGSQETCQRCVHI